MSTVVGIFFYRVLLWCTVVLLIVYCQCNHIVEFFIQSRINLLQVEDIPLDIILE